MIISPVTVIRTPFDISFTSEGTFTYSIPRWCSHIDIVLLGGGGGGGGGDTGWTFAGQGGYGGNWTIRTLIRGVDIPWSLTAIGVTVGAGGAGGAAGSTNTGKVGGNTTVTFANSLGISQNLSAIGGNGGNGGNNGGLSGEVGKSPGNQTYNNQTYIGGGTAASGSGRENGKTPGGGGGGGAGGVFGGGTAGMAGAAGAAFFYAYTKATPLQFTDELLDSSSFTITQTGSGISFTGNEAQWGGTTDGNAMAIYHDPVTTADQYIRGTLGTVATLRASALIFHNNVTNSGYYGVEFYFGTIRLVRSSGAWGANSVTVIATATPSMEEGGLIEAWNYGETFYVAYDGMVVITATIPGAIIGYPYFKQGFGMYRATSTSSTRIGSWGGGSAAAWGK